MGKITRKTIIRELQVRTGLSQRMISQIVENLLEEIQRSLELTEEVKISGFGTFIPAYSKPREGRNLRTGERVSIPPFRKVLFHLSPTLRAELHNEKGK
jgi:nucleoid DNA-binding protein